MEGFRSFALAVTLAAGLQGAPAVLFTDIESGPNTGGPGGLGAPITIYGTGFGAERVRGEVRSQVFIGGVEVNNYLLWGAHNAANPALDKIVVQPGPRVVGGDIVVTVDGVASNALPYTVRPGNFFLLSTAGSDSNDCSLERPCATVARAASLMQPGDFLLVRGGTYREGDIQLGIGDSGRAGEPKAILAYPREEVFFAAAQVSLRLDASFITVGGLRLLSGRSLSLGAESVGNRIIGNTIANGVAAAGHGPLIAGNVCHPGAFRPGPICFEILGARAARLMNNEAVSGLPAGVSVSGGAQDTVLDGNLIVGSRRGIDISDAGGIIARNNTLVGNQHAGIWVTAQGRGAALRHNTFFQNGLSGIVVDGAEGVEIRNNLFFQTAAFCTGVCDVVPLSHIAIIAGIATIERNFYQTPQPVIYGGVDTSPVNGEIFFQDAAAGNYRLNTGSVALDAAMPLDGEDRDADGQPRTAGPGADIGAYEFSGFVLSPGPAPPAPAPDPTPSPTPAPTPDPPPAPTPGSGVAGDPVIFYTDIESGPNAGGENNAGTVVTLYGKNFGASRGSSTVTIGGTEVAAYKAWGAPHLWYEKISVQLGTAARTGNLAVNVNGRASNGMPFVVRPGNIYYLAPNGSDGANGSFTAPWRNAPTARDRMRPGDIVYLLNGFEQTNDDGQGWNTPLLFRTGGGADAPLAWIAYPGATATLGSTAGPGFGIRMADREPGGYLVFSGIRFRGSIVGALASGVVPGSPGLRFIANDFEGREGSCFISQLARNIAFHGNTAHDCGAASRTKELEHGVYFSTDSNGIDMGWNLVTNIPSCRGIQIHSSPLEGLNNGFNQFNIRIHHNLIRDTFCDGIVMATVDPSKGAVEVFNNVFLRAGYGTPINLHGFFSCFYSPGTTNRGAAGTGTVELYNNTMVDCGNSRAGDGWTAAIVNGTTNSRLGLRLRNNIVRASAGVPYAPYGPLTGSNNLFFGGLGAAPASLAATLAADPRFVSTTDFRLTQASPAIDAGTPTGVALDFDGAPRPAGTAIDLGAFEFQVRP